MVAMGSSTHKAGESSANAWKIRQRHSFNFGEALSSFRRD
jgi:hypothetical protein